MIQQSRRYCRPVFVCLSAVVLIAGCGKSSGNVSGKVTLNGSPLHAGGTVTFEGSTRGASGTVNPDGTYSVSNAPVGNVKISVIAGGGAAPTGQAMDVAHMRPPKKLAQSPAVLPRAHIPDKYTKPETSGLTYTVKSGEQTFDIPLNQ